LAMIYRTLPGINAP